MTEGFQCEYCKNYLASRSSLNAHKKKAKYCLKLQGKKIRQKKYKCPYCKALFTYKGAKETHTVFCKTRLVEETVKKDNLLREKSRLIEEKDKELQLVKEEKDKELQLVKEEKDKELQQAKEEIAKLQAKSDIYKELHGDSNNCVKEIAKQPRKVTNKIKNIMNLQPLNIDQVKFPNPTLQDLLKGGKGYADLVSKPLEKLLICTDFARLMFKFLNEQGHLTTDPRLINLSPKIFEKLLPPSEDIVDNYKKNNTLDAENMNRHSKLAILLGEIRGIMKGNTNDLHREFIRELAPKVITQK